MKKIVIKDEIKDMDLNTQCIYFVNWFSSFKKWEFNKYWDMFVNDVLEVEE